MTSKQEMRSLKNNLALFGIKPHILRKQVRSLMPPLAKVVINANMEAMKKDITRLNNIIASGCMDDASKKPKFIQGRHPFIKDGLGHTKGGKTSKRHMVNGVPCIKFEKKETIGEV
jgi:hypothetical protein